MTNITNEGGAPTPPSDRKYFVLTINPPPRNSDVVLVTDDQLFKVASAMAESEGTRWTEDCGMNRHDWSLHQFAYGGGVVHCFDTAEELLAFAAQDDRASDGEAE